MTTTPEFNFLQAIRKEIAERVDDVGNQLAGGQVTDWAAYREKVGYLNGLRHMLAFAEQQNELFMRK